MAQTTKIFLFQPPPRAGMPLTLNQLLQALLNLALMNFDPTSLRRELIKSCLYFRGQFCKMQR